MTKHRREQSGYQSYLLRLWQTSDGRKTLWRASLQSPGSEERHGFASLEELMSFLKAQVEQPEDERRKSNR
jgi:hypothetical protein